ncbi:MAG: porin [Pseudomonadota bacterium]
MHGLLKYGALVALVGASGAAYADSASTKGGLSIKSDDGRFEAKLGGRIHFDTYLAVDEDDITDRGEDLTSTTDFRRTRLTLEGKAYGWKYKFECDFTSSGKGCYREMWLGTTLGPANLRIGQAKPYRGMEELTSSNEILFMERPFATASGVYSGTQYAQGLFVDGNGANWTWGVAGYSLRSSGEPATEGVGAAARATFAPVATETTVFHIGLSASTDRPTDEGIEELEAGGRPYGRIAGGTNLAVTPDERTGLGVELAAKAGPFYGQAEFASVDFKNEAAGDESVDASYIQASWLLTGESKPYDPKKGVFKSPKPNGAIGAWELKARYDLMEGEDNPNDEISTWIVGANWYVNPNVRFMLEYLTGIVDQGTEVEASVVQLRSQFNL